MIAPSSDRRLSPQSPVLSPRVLVRRVCGLGDLVLTLPFFRALRVLHPTAEIHMMGHPEHLELLEAAGCVAAGCPEDGSGWHHLYAGGRIPWDTLRPDPRAYDLICVFVPDPESSPLVTSLRAVLGERLLAIPARPSRGQRTHAALHPLGYLPLPTPQGLEITLPLLVIPSRQGRGKTSQGYLKSREGWDLPLHFTSPALAFPRSRPPGDALPPPPGPRPGNETAPPPSRSEESPDPRRDVRRECSRRWRKPAIFDAGQRHVIIHPGSGTPRKNWPTENFVALLGRVSGGVPQAKPWLLEGPADAKAIRDISSGLAQEMEIPVLRPDRVTDLAALLQEAALFLGNDSGVTHLSAAMGISTFAIFGPSDPAVWAPIGPKVHVLYRDASCEPCHVEKERQCLHPICPRFPSLEEVWEAVLPSLRG